MISSKRIVLLVRLTPLAAVALILAAASVGCEQLASPPSSRTATSATSRTRQEQTVTLPYQKRYGGTANLIFNPSFERRISPWAPAGNESLLQLTRKTHRYGAASVRVVATTTYPYGIQLAGAVGSPGLGDAFRLSTWLRAAGRPKKITLRLLAYGPRPQVQMVAQRDVIVGTKWVRVSLGGRIRDANRDSLTVTIVVQKSIAIGDAFFVDGVLLTSTPAGS